MPPKAKDDSAVLAKVGEALSVFASFLGGRAAPRATEAAASGAGASEDGDGAEESAEVPVATMTLQDVMLQLRRPPPQPFAIDTSSPLRGFEGLLTRAPTATNEFIIYMQDGLRQEAMLEQLDRFVSTLASEDGARASRGGAMAALVRALHQPHQLIEIEEGEHEDPPYNFPKTCSSSRVKVTALFESGRTAMIDAGTWINSQAFARTYRKVRKAMIRAAESVELKQQIAEHLPASINIDEYDIFKALGVFRSAKESTTIYLNSLAIFEAAPAAPAVAAAAAPAQPPAAEPAEAPPYVMQNHTLVAHARKEADSCKAQGINKYTTIHIDSQTAGLMTEALRPLALDRKAFRWTRLNCKSDNPAEAIGASIFMFCDNVASIDAAISTIKSYQAKCAAIPRFGTPFMEIVNKMTIISYVEPSFASNESARQRP